MIAAVVIEKSLQLITYSVRLFAAFEQFWPDTVNVVCTGDIGAWVQLIYNVQGRCKTATALEVRR